MGMDEWVSSYVDSPSDEKTSLEAPLLVFDVRELLLPGQKRYLHLYEARFLQGESSRRRERGAVNDP